MSATWQQAALDWQTLGFSLTPTGVHPFGTSNRLAMFGNNFLELLAVTDAAAVPTGRAWSIQLRRPQPGFSRHRRGNVDAGDAQRRCPCRCGALQAPHHIGAYAPFDFSRDAVLPSGGTARVEFSLAFATDPAMPGIAFFTCQQRHPPELFWKPQYQRHPNGALRVIEVVMSAPEPAVHRGFLEHITESAAELAPGRLTVGARGDRITVLGPAEMARRLPGLAVAPIAALLRRARGGHRSGCDQAGLEKQRRRVRGSTDAVLLVPPAASHGLALEFVEQETI